MRGLFDHLFGAGEKHWRKLEAERFGGLEVDDELELSWLQHRQLSHLGTPENPPDIVASLTMRVSLPGSVAHQPADFREVAQRISRRYLMTSGECDDVFAPTHQERIGDGNEKRANLLLDHGCESGVKVALSADA